MKYAFFIGRWQPFHDGHKWLINQKLKNNIPVLIGIMDNKKDDRNPYSAREVEMMIKDVYQNENVVTIIIPPIESVNYGRNVGYEINEFKPPPEIKKISGTRIRNEAN